MCYHLAEPKRSKQDYLYYFKTNNRELAEPLGSMEPRLKNTAFGPRHTSNFNNQYLDKKILGYKKMVLFKYCCWLWFDLLNLSFFLFINNFSQFFFFPTISFLLFITHTNTQTSFTCVIVVVVVVVGIFL